MQYPFQPFGFLPKRACSFAIEGPSGDYRTPEKRTESRTAQELSDLKKNVESSQAPEIRAEQPAEAEKPLDAARLRKALQTGDRPVEDLLNNRRGYGQENLASVPALVLVEMKTPSAVESFTREQNAGELEQGLAGNREIVLRDLGNLGVLT